MNVSDSHTLYLTGGTGFVGTALTHAWLAISDRHKVIIQTRRPHKYPANRAVTYVSSLDEVDASIAIKAVVNLAGAPIADRRWTQSRKRVLEASRIQLTAELSEKIGKRALKPEVIVNASAIGFYGLGERVTTESQPHGEGFAAELCQKWEEQALALGANARLAILRFGVVLGHGGALDKLLPIFKLGLGGPIGSGKQWFSWVHIDDVVGGILYAIHNEASEGVYNLTAPRPVQQGEFAKVLAGVLHRPAKLMTPTLMLSLVFGQMAKELLIGGQRVVPERLLEEGFEFYYPELESAIQSIAAPPKAIGCRVA